MPTGQLTHGSLFNTSAGINNAVLDHHFLLVRPFEAPYIASHIMSAVAGAKATCSVVSLAKTGSSPVTTFSSDWYNRIHISPLNVNVGNLLSLQTRNITVWNAFFEPKTLTGISEDADSGIELVQPRVLPVTFSALEVSTYQLRVDVTGPPSVTGSFLFDFGFVVLKLTASGNRVVVWPFPPQHGVVESLEWKTDVIRAKACEQRIALRDAPRQSFSYKHFMNDRQVSRARAMAVGWAQRQFGVPVWTEATYIGQVLEGVTVLNIDTASADYRVGDSLVLWQSDEVFEAVGIEEMTGSTITLKLPISVTMDNTYVAPLRYARASGIKMDRGANQLVKMDADFNVLLNVDLGASIGLPTFAELDVLTDSMHVVTSHDERIEKVITVVDNGFGVTSADGVYSTTDQFFSVSWSFTNRADLWRIRKWLHSLKGRQKVFWLPTNTADFELVMNIASGATGLSVKSINYPLYYTTRTIQISRKDGTRSFHSITGGATEGYTDVLSLAEAATSVTTISDVDKISLMYKVRLDADRVEINHSDSGFVTIRVPVTEVVK